VQRADDLVHELSHALMGEARHNGLSFRSVSVQRPSTFHFMHRPSITVRRDNVPLIKRPKHAWRIRQVFSPDQTEAAAVAL
jgi:hypothetical protein